jgi:hypothetical protein
MTNTTITAFDDADDSAAVTSEEIGQFFTETAAKLKKEDRRSLKGSIGRLLEEVVELALAANMEPGRIFEHVTDSLHNQAIKKSKEKAVTVFPSELAYQYLPSKEHYLDLVQECADVSLFLKDVYYMICEHGKHSGLTVSLPSVSRLERRKFAELRSRQLTITDRGLIYTKKSHVNKPD